MNTKRFQIINTLKEGRLGGVYEAIDKSTQQKITLRRFFPAKGVSDSLAWQKEFAHLAENLTFTQHPTVAIVYSTGCDEVGAYVAQEFLNRGRSIDQIVEKGKHLTNEEFYIMANNLLTAFAFIHEQGFYHGWITGSSVMEATLPTGRRIYKCVDLGVSQMTSLMHPHEPLESLLDTALAAPELFEGKQADVRSDVYMLGNLFYLSLAGGHPLAGLPLRDAIERHKTHKFAPLSGYRSSVPKEIVNWIETLIQADPNARPQNAGAALATMPSQKVAMS